METRLQEELEPWKNPEFDEDQGDILPMIQEDPIPGGSRDQFVPLVPPLSLSNRRLMHAAQKRSNFERAFSAQRALTVDKRVSKTIERDAFTIALGRRKAMAAPLDLDVEHMEIAFREWLLTASIPIVPGLPDPHCRKYMHEIQNGKISHGLKSDTQAWESAKLTPRGSSGNNNRYKAHMV
jgi:hypothetical protein